MSKVKTMTGSGRFAHAENGDEVFMVDPSIKARQRETIIVILARTLILLVLLTSWEFVSGRWVEEFWISSPSSITLAFWTMITNGVLMTNISATLLEAVLGFVAGVFVGVLMGVICGANRLISRVLDPFLIGFYSLPRIALVPLFILWFGIGLETKVIYTALLVFFPVFMNTLSGVRDVSQDLIDVIRVLGASRWDTVKKILIPSALAWLFAGLRISVPYALVGAIVAEMFTSNVGLGYLISYFANQFDTASLFATLGVTTLLGLTVHGIVSRVEKYLLRWKPTAI